MAAFEPTYHQSECDYSNEHGATLAMPAALCLPKGHLAIRQCAVDMIAKMFRSETPRTDLASIARFVRNAYSQGILTAADLKESLSSNHQAGLYHLSHLGALRVGQRTKLVNAICKKTLETRLANSTVAPPEIAAMAAAGNRLGLYDAQTLRDSFTEMCNPLVQFPEFWWKRLMDTHAGKLASNHIHEHFMCELIAYEEGLFVDLHTYSPMVHQVTVPGGEAPESIMLRDTILTLVHSLISATMGMSPADCISCELPLEDDAAGCLEFMGGDFTGPELLVRLAEAHGIYTNDPEEREHALRETSEDFFSMCEAESLKDWSDVMATLAKPNHWLTRSFVAGDTLAETYVHCKGMVDALRQQYGEAYPTTLVVAEEILEAIKERVELERPSRSGLDEEFHHWREEGLPFCFTLQAWLSIRGGNSHVGNLIYRNLLPSACDDRFNSGQEYHEGFFISRQGDDSAEALAHYIRDFSECSHLLESLAKATDAEVMP